MTSSQGLLPLLPCSPPFSFYRFQTTIIPVSSLGHLTDTRSADVYFYGLSKLDDISLKILVYTLHEYSILFFYKNSQGLTLERIIMTWWTRAIGKRGKIWCARQNSQSTISHDAWDCCFCEHGWYPSRCSPSFYKDWKKKM